MAARPASAGAVSYGVKDQPTCGIGTHCGVKYTVTCSLPSPSCPEVEYDISFVVPAIITTDTTIPFTDVVGGDAAGQIVQCSNGAFTLGIVDPTSSTPTISVNIGSCSFPFSVDKPIDTLGSFMSTSNAAT
ncbi:MAG TPA: hypothetical protein VKB26_02580 [Candidatus Acidoferrales bacterium]|nr:hypothetical protein [Candidatus Acidoferrales bacterium]